MHISSFPTAVCVCVSLLFVAACASPTSASQVWIDVPIDGLKAPPGTSLQVEGHAAAPGGVARVEVWVDGQLLQSVDSPIADGAVARFAVDWSSPEPGAHTIEAIAISADGEASTPDQARVIIAPMPPTDTPTPVISPTPPPTLTVTPSAIEFWADPPQIEAGACTDVRWRVQNVASVRLGGTTVDPEGKYHVCLCEGEIYTLTVVLPDGTEEKRRVEIAVEGECETPTPVPDTTGPPAPPLDDPGDGESFACTGHVELDWDSVDDPSGVAEYRVQAERHSGDGNWQSVSGSPWAGSDTSRSISVECGWTYRWRVRAVDTLGNAGPWSGWSTFVDQLM
jgi:hypothetical protein